MTLSINYNCSDIRSTSLQTNSTSDAYINYSTLVRYIPRIPWRDSQISMTKPVDFIFVMSRRAITKDDILNLFPKQIYLTKEQNDEYQSELRKMSLGPKGSVFDFYAK